MTTDPTAPPRPDPGAPLDLEWREEQYISIEIKHRSELYDADIEFDPHENRWFWSAQIYCGWVKGSSGDCTDAEDGKRKVAAWLKANL